MKKMNRAIFFTILLLTNMVEAREYEFKFIYAPTYIETCSSISDSNVYLQRNKSKLNFKILMDMSKLDTKTLIANAENYSFKIYSSKGKGHSIPSTKPIKTISFADFLGNSGEFNQINGLSLRLKIPKKIRKSGRFDVNGIKFNAWNILVFLQNDSTGKVLSASSYGLQFLPKGLSFYEKIEESARNYSLNALPDSKLYDNSSSMETLVVNKFFEENFSKTKDKEYQSGYGFSFGANTNYGVRIIDSDYYMFFNENYHSYGPNLSSYGVSFSAFDKFSKSKFVKVHKNHSIMNHFEILPGSSAILFEQAHVEVADYKKFSADECGFLAEDGTVTKSVMSYSYHMIPVDRTRYLEDQYLQNLSSQFLPIYDFR